VSVLFTFGAVQVEILAARYHEYQSTSRLLIQPYRHSYVRSILSIKCFINEVSLTRLILTSRPTLTCAVAVMWFGYLTLILITL